MPRNSETFQNLVAAADPALYRHKLREILRYGNCEDQMPDTGVTAAGTGPERRRSERLLLDVTLLVRGESPERKPFEEETFTISVSAHGALVLLATKVALGQILFLRNPETQRETEGWVSRFGSPYGGLAQVGIEFARPAPELWPVKSPPAGWKAPAG